jgi:heme exporter protein B
LPALSLFFGVRISFEVVSAVLIATAGMAVLGCLFGALVARVRARELLLPVLTLPLWIPFIVVGGQAVQSAMGATAAGTGQATGLLLDLDILFVVLTSLAARFVLDD